MGTGDAIIAPSMPPAPGLSASIVGSTRVWRRPAGVLIASMLSVSIISTLWSAVPAVVAPILAWSALVLLWSGLGVQQRAQAVVFCVVGIVALWWGLSRGAALSIEGVLGQNQAILSLLASITLLRLLNPPVREVEPELPRGLRTYLRSMVGVHAFGAVINVSAVIIMADRLARAAPLTMAQAQLLSRAFTAVAFYSPFIGGVALALVYTPGSNPLLMMLFGVPLSLVALGLLSWYARTGRVDDIVNFRGYPVHLEGLWLPVVLATAVLLASVLTSDYSVLSLITMLTPLVVGGALLQSGGLGGLRRSLADYVNRRLPEMGGELTLFLAAGVLGTGLVTAFGAESGWVPFDHFDAFNASLMLLVFPLTSLMCIHPVVIVSVAAPLLATTGADPTFLAIVFAMGWGLGCALNPMSGINLVLHTRYGVSNWTLGRTGIPFSATLYPVAVGLLHIYERVFL